MQDEPYRVPLRCRDGSVVAYALIDAVDAPDIAPLSWYRGSKGYPMRQYREPGNHRQLRVDLMHRRVMGLTRGDGLEVDHINRNKLDNRRVNLRIVSHSENEQNKNRAVGSSGYRNVVWYAHKQRYVARLQVGGKWKTKGGFLDPESASVAAEELRRIWHPCAS